MKNKTSDYYFCVVEDDAEFHEGYEDFDPPWVHGVDATMFYIVPKRYWDTYGYLYEGCIIKETDVPKEFSEAQEGIYEITADKETGRQLLLKAGFIEKDLGY